MREINSRIIRWAEHVARMVRKRGVYRILVGKSEGKISLGRSRHKWEDIINMDLREMGCRGMDWIDLTEEKDRRRALIYAVMNLPVL